MSNEKFRPKTHDISSIQFLFFRKIGDPSAQNFKKHELRYAVQFPGPYRDKMDKLALCESQWEELLAQHTFYNDLPPFARAFYEAIAKGANLSVLNTIIEDFQRLTPTLDILESIGNIDFLKAIDPFSSLSRFHSNDIRNFLWDLMLTTLNKITPEETQEALNEIQSRRLQQLFWLAVCSHQEEERIQLLITHGAQIEPTQDEIDAIDAEENVSITPLHFACWSGNINTLQCLLNNGANPEIHSEQEITPLHLACKHATSEMVSLLLRYTRYENNKFPSGHDPFYYACIGGNTETAQCLIELNYVSSEDLAYSVADACESGNLELIKFLYRKGAPLHKGNPSPLNIACATGYTSAVKFLLENHVNETDTPSLTTTLLRIAGEKNNVHTAVFLLNGIQELSKKLGALLLQADYPGFTKIISRLPKQNIYDLLEYSIRQMPEKNHLAWDTYWEKLAEIYATVIKPIGIEFNNSDLLLLCAIRTQQPQDEIEHIITALDANVDRAGEKYNQIPIHISSQFNPAVTCIMLQYGSSHSYEFALPSNPEPDYKRLKK